MAAVLSGGPPTVEPPDPPDPMPSTLESSPPCVFSSAQLLLFTVPLSSPGLSLSVTLLSPPPTLVVSSPASTNPLLAAPSRVSPTPSLVFVTSPPLSVLTDPSLSTSPTSLGLWSSSHALCRLLTPPPLQSGIQPQPSLLHSEPPLLVLFLECVPPPWYLKNPARFLMIVERLVLIEYKVPAFDFIFVVSYYGISVVTSPCLSTSQSNKFLFPPAIWYSKAPPMFQVMVQPSLLSSPPWWRAPPYMVCECSELLVLKVCLRRDCSNLVEFFHYPYHVTYASLGFMEMKFWVFMVGIKIRSVSDINKLVICCVDSGVISYACRRPLAAWCRVLRWLCLVQPLIYRHLCRAIELSLVLSLHFLVANRSARISSNLEMESVSCYIRNWWSPSVDFPPPPPVPPDPPDYIFFMGRPFVFWISAVLTLSRLGDMSIMTVRASSASTPFSNQGSFLLVIWNAWRLTSLCPISRINLLRIKLLSSHLPLYEDARLVLSSPLPLYEDRFTLPLYEDRFTLPLYEEFVTLPLYEDSVTLPLYEDLCSFMEFITPLCSPFVLNRCVSRGVIKGSFDRCLIASVAILEIGNCALVAVPISGVRSNTQGFILLNNPIVEEIRGLLQDFYLFKCYVAIIPLCFYASSVVVFSFYAIMAMLFENTYSVYGD